MAIAAATPLPLEGVCCSTSYWITNSCLIPSFDRRRVPGPAGIRCKIPFFGSTQFHWLSSGHDLCLSKVSVAADYPDSVPDSSSYTSHRAYHPLEDLKVSRRIRYTKLSSAETARTTVEANNFALLVFPGMVHCEPHEQISWAEFQYVIDDYGDIYFEIFDDANILEDRGASNPVNVLIGMEIPIYKNRNKAAARNISIEEGFFDDEVGDSEGPDISVDWGMLDTSSLVHPIYFAKCLTMASNMEYNKKIDDPSNGVSIVGCLRPAFADEESYIRTLFHCVDSDGYSSDWKDEEFSSLNSESDQVNTGSTLYRLEMMRIELFSVYGVQSEVSLQDFLDAEPDVLAHSTPAIVERFGEMGISCNVALKALCKKKGLDVESAHLIGIDSLGMDVRVFSGVEVQTHRFPFKVKATSEVAAEKQIQQLLFPRSRRKKLRNHGVGLRDVDSY
ncbi:uncharacterized protein At3g49140 isoform X3 [Juglans microcarpa x Juglans regia]|uniref:uncharacterized protein At3g49140 isoform X3 n=1 Tax=Juglans microcarpa x Juglans regia TaxID=2249226 RepID=UPI001B7E7BA4|nr:uncharacterized protein At3g49140 isoform X3 [Juglans microcarpa x Juglans regia]